VPLHAARCVVGASPELSWRVSCSCGTGKVALGVARGPALILLFPFQFVLKNYGENPENYNEELRKLELLRQVSRAPSRIARSPGETRRGRSGGAGSPPTPCSRTRLPAPTASLDRDLCRDAATAAPLPRRWPADEAFDSHAASRAPQTIQGFPRSGQGLDLRALLPPIWGVLCWIQVPRWAEGS